MNKRYSPNEGVRKELKQLLHFLRANNATITASHIAGAKNVVADKLSRVAMGDNWQLQRVLFDTIQGISWNCTIDRFATAHNALLPRFNSYF